MQFELFQEWDSTRGESIYRYVLVKLPGDIDVYMQANISVGCVDFYVCSEEGFSTGQWLQRPEQNKVFKSRLIDYSL
jgi:hypothetical protein